MLKDGFGRVHDYLRISLTDACNFHCLYCLPNSPYTSSLHKSTSSHKNVMSAEEIDGIAKIFVNEGVKKIRLTGGEPLIRKDGKEIIQQLAKYDVELAITTNGLFIDEYLETFLKTGLRSVNVSLDSLMSKNFKKLTGNNQFEKVVRNIYLLLENNFHVKVNVVVLNGHNDSEINDFIAWTKDYPLHIRFIEFMPFPGNQWKPDSVLSYKEILERIQAQFPDIEKLFDDKHDTAKKHKVKSHVGTFAVISTMSQPFCEGCNRLRLTADGKMRNCLFAKSETDLLTPFRNGEDISPLIRECLFGKHYMLGGNNENEWAQHQTEGHKRTMMGIGG